MPTELKMPALSPTMEEGTLAKWLVKEGDEVKSGDILAEIETDKATMEFEAVDEGTIAKILVAEGTDGVKVGAPIAILAGEGEDVSAAAPKADTAPAEAPKAAAAPAPKADETPKARARSGAGRDSGRSAAARRAAARRRRPGEGVAAGPPPGPGAGHRSQRAAGQRPGRTHRPRRRRCGGRQGSCGGSRRCAGSGAGACHPCRPSGTDGAGDPARGDQAFEHPQDDRAPPDGIEAAGPAHLSDGRYPARRAAEASRRAQRGARKPRREAVGQRSDDQGARPGADRGAGVQRQLRRRPVVQVQPRRRLRRRVDPGRPDHADHRRRGHQERFGDLGRDEGPRRPREGGQAPADRNIRAAPPACRTWACTASSSSKPSSIRRRA